MKNNLIVIGAGGHGKVVAELALRCGYHIEGFLDDGPELEEHFGYPVLGKVSRIGEYAEKYSYVIAIGGQEIRRSIAGRYPVSYATLIHPAAVIGHGAAMGEGTVVMANAVVNPDAVIGKHCIINTGAVVEHDNVIGDFTHISPGAVLAGAVQVGAGCQIGAGAVIRNHVSICHQCIIGAGAAVVKDIGEPGIYIGVPAKKRQESEGMEWEAGY